MEKYSFEYVTVKNTNGWDYTQVGVFADDKKIFEFIRNYPSLAPKTTKVYYSQKDGKNYLIYSDFYNRLSIYNLTDRRIVDLSKDSLKQIEGFCPTEIYIPHYYTELDEGSILYMNRYECQDDNKTDEEMLMQHDFAFVMGCIWGDDSQMSVNLLDLKDIDSGNIFYTLDLKGSIGWTYIPLNWCIPLKDFCYILDNHTEKDIQFDRTKLFLWVSEAVRLDKYVKNL